MDEQRIGPSTNVEIVRRVMRGFNDKDLDAALDDIDPEAELDYSNSDAPDSGVYRSGSGRRWRNLGCLRL
jgi:hypothetical protein